METFKIIFRVLSFITFFIGLIILQEHYKIWEAFGILLLVGLPVYGQGFFDSKNE